MKSTTGNGNFRKAYVKLDMFHIRNGIFIYIHVDILFFFIDNQQIFGLWRKLVYVRSTDYRHQKEDRLCSME